MLSQLTIKNFGLIDRLEVEFHTGLNIFTGETGAGKSILIDAVRYALGDRLNSAQIRDRDKACVVETVFELSDRQLREFPVFSEYISDDEPALIINRTFTPDGRNKNKINGFTVTVSELKEIGNHLVDFHGPHDHQMLLSEDSHIGILDRLSKLDTEKDQYLQKYNIYFKLQKELNELQKLSEHREREQDTLSHQIKELEQVPLEAAKYEELLQETNRVNNSEKLYGSVSQLIDILENEQTGISKAATLAFGPMRTLNGIDETTKEFAEFLEQIQANNSELSAVLNNYLDRLSFQPGEADEINRRYDIYYDLMRKYGPTLEDAMGFYKTAQKKYEQLANLEHNDKELRKNIETVRGELDKFASNITTKRKKTAKILEKTIEKELKELGIAHVAFECRIEKTEINRTGHDKVIFYISPNAGEALKPLAEIVSSGEAARMMLALKKALTKVDPMPVLIFDEIDAQIGGRLGTITGKKLKELSSDRQVILITHLPQIASFGDHHFKVLKEVKNNRTATTVAPLAHDSRVKELAQMMSGKEEHQIAVKHAEEMLSRAKTG